MGELTEQEKLERRRLKRQQRILQAGESRLNKITGTAYRKLSLLKKHETDIVFIALRATPSPTPSPSTSSINNNNSSTTSIPSSFNTQRRMSDDPSEELGAPPPLDMNTLMQQQMASIFGGVSGVPGSAPSDPLQQMFGNAAAGGPNGFNPATLLSSMMNGGATPEQTEQQQQMDKSSRYWNLLHVVMMVMLGFYAVYTEWTRAGRERFASLLSSDVNNYPNIHVPLFWYFITIELCLQSARLFYQQGVMPPTSTLASLATQLPPPFGNIVTICLRYRLIWSCLSQDICILVFVIGISQVISNIL